MSKTHWKKLQNPNYLGAYSLLNDETGKYTDVILTVESVAVEPIISSDGKRDERPVMHFAERDTKPMILNVTNSKMMEKLFKTPIIEEWANRKIQIGVETVKAFGDVTEALRIRKFLPRTTETPKCADTGKEIAATEKMTVAQIVAATQKRYGRALCAERWMALVEQERFAGAEGSNDETDGN